MTGGMIVAMPVTKTAPPSAKVSFLQFRSTALPFHFSFCLRKTPGSYVLQEVLEMAFCNDSCMPFPKSELIIALSTLETDHTYMKY